MLCNIVMVEVLMAYMMSKSGSVAVVREQGEESTLLSMPSEFRLLCSPPFQGFEKKDFVKPIPATRYKSPCSSSSVKMPYAD